MTSPVVTLSQGKLIGKVSEAVRGGNFFSFQGIPYAQPPVGKLRFKAPQPAEPWIGVFDASEEGHQCLQKHYLTKQILGSEDCLHVNVYTRELPEHHAQPNLKPVMVFIHGGAFAQGSNKTEIYGPEFLMTEDIVLVVINYRLGLLGFLSLEDPSLQVPGNAGFKDMVLALKWVRDNITKFSGDSNNITIFGESAGATAAHFLMLSPMSQGLFHKVIAQSGCALNGWAYGRNVTKELAKEIGFENDEDEADILQYLENASIDDIFKCQEGLDQKDILANKARYLGLVIEKPSDEPAFFSCSPLDIILSGNYSKLPMIMGYNSMEGMLFDILVKKEKQCIYWNDVESNVPSILNLEKGSHVSKVVGDKIIKFYLGTGEIKNDSHTKQLYEVTTDNCFLHGIYRTVKNYVSVSPYPVYMYRMSIETDLNTYKRLTGVELPGVCHADDLGYLFKNIFTPEIAPNSIEEISQKRFAKLWTNFARYGNPTVGDDPILNVQWKPVEKNKVNFLDIGEKLTMQCDPEPKRMAFWDEIFRISPVASKL